MKRIIIACAIAAAAGGCYKSKIHLTSSTGTPSTLVDNAFHFSLLGIFELSSAVDLKAACGGGEASGISERVSFLGGIVNLIFGTYLPIFEVMNPTVECGGAAPAPAAAPAAAPAETPPPAK